MIISRGSRGILSTKVTVLLRHSCRLQVIVSKEETPARATRLISCRRGPKIQKPHFRSRAPIFTAPYENQVTPEPRYCGGSNF